MRCVQLLHNWYQSKFDETYSHSHGRKTIPMWRMLKMLLAKDPSQPTPKGSQVARCCQARWKVEIKHIKITLLCNRLISNKNNCKIESNLIVLIEQKHIHFCIDLLESFQQIMPVKLRLVRQTRREIFWVLTYSEISSNIQVFQNSFKLLKIFWNNEFETMI